MDSIIQIKEFFTSNPHRFEKEKVDEILNILLSIQNDIHIV